MKLCIHEQQFKRNNFRTVKAFIKSYLDNCAPATYYEDGKIQCERGRNRSFGDLYYITKSIFPSITKKKLAYYLLIFLKGSPKNEILVCPTIGKVVISIYSIEAFPSMTFSWRNLENFRNGTFRKSSNIYKTANRTFKRIGRKDKMSIEKVVSMSDSYQNKLNNKKLKNEKRI